MTAPPHICPPCCTCDPVGCETDETGESCVNCPFCVNGCPAPEGNIYGSRCCTDGRAGTTP